MNLLSISVKSVFVRRGILMSMGGIVGRMRRMGRRRMVRGMVGVAHPDVLVPCPSPRSVAKNLVLKIKKYAYACVNEFSTF